MLQLCFDPFPVIDTERLILRRLTLADAADYFALRTNDEVMAFIERKRPASIIDMEEHIRKVNQDVDGNRTIVWTISAKGNDQLAGTIAYHKITPEHYRAEIGYLLHPAHWRTGIMSEAIKAVLEFGFGQMGLHSIEAIINPLNEGSRKLLTKFGFIKEGYFKENYFYNGQFLDSEVYSLLSTKT